MKFITPGRGYYRGDHVALASLEPVGQAFRRQCADWWPGLQQACPCATPFVNPYQLMMIDEETLAQINGRYVCPPWAGPAWRAASEAGVDMSLIEHSLTLTPEQRLQEHQQVIDFLLTVREAGEAHASE